MNNLKVRQKYGVIERMNNSVGKGRQKALKTPHENFETIEDALKLYKMI